jgi:WD40 repeat protein
MNHRFSLFQTIFVLSVFACIVSACSSSIHKDFLANFVEGSKNPDGPLDKRVVSLAYHDKDKYLVVGHESGSIDIWDAKEARSKREVKAHMYRANLISFASDGARFFSNSYFEQSTKLWSAKTGELLLSISDTRGSVCATPNDDIYLIATSEGSTVRFFDLARKILLTEEYKSSGVVQTMAMDTASEQIAIGTASGTIEVWSFSRIGPIPKLQHTATAKPYATGNWVVGLQFSPGGKRLYSVASSGVIDEWESATLKKYRSLPVTIRIKSSTFLQDKSLVALAGTVDKEGFGAGTVELVSLSTGRSTLYRSSTNFPVAEFLSGLSSLIITQFQSIQVHPLDDK